MSWGWRAVVPIHTMYELINDVTRIANAGYASSSGGKCLVSVDIMVKLPLSRLETRLN